ncbi:MAG: nitronate monooxygenase [Geminicoccaceae bacterium]
MGLYPPDFVQHLKKRGISWWANVSTVAEARAAEAAGADVVVAQGMEAGGHRQTSGRGTNPKAAPPNTDAKHGLVAISERINLAGWGWPSFGHQQAEAGCSTLQGGPTGPSWKPPADALGSSCGRWWKGERHSGRQRRRTGQCEAWHGLHFLIGPRCGEAPLGRFDAPNTWPYRGPEPNSKDGWPPFPLLMVHSRRHGPAWDWPRDRVCEAHGAYSTDRGQPFHAIVGANSTPSRAG